MGANTPTTYYLDTPDLKAKCAQDFAKIEQECGPDDQPDKDGKKKKVRPSIRKLLGKKFKDKGYGKTLSGAGTDNTSWMADNCDLLWISPLDASGKKFQEQLAALKGDLAEAVDGALTKTLEAAKDKIKQEAIDLAQKKAGQAAARAGGRWMVGAAGAAAGGVGGLVTEGIATVVNLVDMAATGIEVVTTGYDAYKEIGALKEVLDEYKDIGKELDRLSTRVKGNPEEAMADFMAGVAKANPCMRARRCSLVPYNQVNNLGGQGCCPGQTGHHLIPDAAVKDAGCTGYDAKKAPTVCAEGTSHGTGGSHGALHTSLDDGMKTYKLRSKKDTMSYEQYRGHAIGSFYRTFPESGCDRKCLVAQLDAYYKCDGKSLKAVSGKGGGFGGNE